MISEHLSAGQPLLVYREYRDYRAEIEVAEAGGPWPVPMIVQLRQKHRNLYMSKNCSSVNEMLDYLWDLEVIGCHIG